MTPVEMFKFVIKTISDFLKLLYFTAVSMAVLHLLIAFSSYQFLTSYWLCEPKNRSYYEPLNCLGMLTYWGFGEVLLFATFIAYCLLAWFNSPPRLTFSPEDAERLERDRARRGAYGSNEALVREFMAWAGTPESYKEDSPYVSMTPPSWQFSVWRAQTEAKKTLIGHGCRINGHLVINYHVLNTAPLDQLYLAIIRPGKETVVQSLATFQFSELLPDICVCPIAQLKGIQLTGLKEAKVKHVQGFQPAYIATDFPDNNASTAAVINHPEAWGMLQYKGSTRPGFSGATYVHGSSLFGIHCHGGIQNVGYSASYIALKLKNNESSDYYALQAMLRSSRDRDYQSQRVNPDEFEIRFQGRYFIIETEEYQELEDNYGDGSDFHPRSKKKAWRNRQDWENNTAFDPMLLPWENNNVSPSSPSQQPPSTTEIATQTEMEWENAPVFDDGFRIQQLTARVDALMAQCDSEREQRLALRQQCEREWANTTMWIEALNDKIMRLWDRELGLESEDEDDPRELFPGVVFENADPEPTVPEIEITEVVEPEAPNANSPTQNTMGGATSGMQEPTSSHPPSPNQAHLSTSQMDSLISGLQQHQQQSARALQSIQSILAQQTALLSRLTPENHSSQERGSGSGTAPVTRRGNRWSRRTRRPGSRQPGASTGPEQQASAPSRVTQPSRTRLDGTASASPTVRTGRSSSNSSQPALTPSQRAAAAALRRNPRVQPAQQTSSSS
ncbi:hypothetical protein 1 [Hubei sobemo-like virus 5]|uniref:hypothetical protein 1 n=1 Tax=Hubei sobemo-like virus 5 TaxID=1923238 RepID=UPI00090BFD82|nr:hypothetical protein 1 [Hubei sobemo-like virus 5]APG75851.1 hypothetical protein 1 [Hubei sobemo-like virus 5]